tara:strand:+ start:1780 stop:2517 length:738 start_codon:yes stop_codon:yes gene_type:complete
MKHFDERIVPDNVPIGILSMHIKRYEFVKSYMRRGYVLDVACGVGYGSRYLVDAGFKVIGVDIDVESVSYAQSRYSVLGNPKFVVADAIAMGFGCKTFDVICSFETIEHIKDPNLFLQEIKRLLKDDGIFVVSTPIASDTTNNPANPFHFQEWSPNDFRNLLSKYFDHVELFSQVRRQTDSSTLLKRLDILNLRKWFLPKILVRKLANIAGVQAMDSMLVDHIDIIDGIVEGASEIIIIAKNEND